MFKKLMARIVFNQKFLKYFSCKLLNQHQCKNAKIYTETIFIYLYMNNHNTHIKFWSFSIIISNKNTVIRSRKISHGHVVSSSTPEDEIKMIRKFIGLELFGIPSTNRLTCLFSKNQQQLAVWNVRTLEILFVTTSLCLNLALKSPRENLLFWCRIDWDLKIV